MKRRTILFGSILALSTALGTIAGCGGASQTGSSGKKIVTMVTSPDYPPYEFYQTTGGDRKIIGFDVEIAQYITKKLGYELKISESDFNGLIPSLQAKRADFVMAGMTPTADRKKNVDFSTVYYEAKDTIVAPKSSNLTATSSLAGKTVGVQLGSIQEQNIKKIAEKVKGITVKSLNKVPDLIQELRSKRIDAAIIEDTVAKGFVESNTDLGFNAIPPEGESGSAIAFPKGSPLAAEFNPVLEEMKANGELKKLAAKWFAESAPPSPSPSPSK